MIISCDTPYVDSAWLNILAEEAEKQAIRQLQLITTERIRSSGFISMTLWLTC